MKRLIIATIVGLVVGGAGGFGAGVFIYPFWFLNDMASETLAPDTQRTKLAGGTFIHANKMDPVHYGEGQVTIFQDPSGGTVVFLHEDFLVRPGPRFHVYLVDHPEVRTRSNFLDADKVDLGRLRNFRGSQVYTVPVGIDVAAYKSVVIWCKEFGVLISPASLSTALVNILPDHTTSVT
ncbi:MAG: DM13 domain-containing protein [Alphaproteobacteria bacterium]|nr:DM13 domain-containing protein [Alphaproteobacteria bacterium]